LIKNEALKSKGSPQIESKDLDLRALARVALMLNFKEQTK
jgi:hypothetical protein